MKQALVIGGMGNIGLAVTQELVQHGYDVTVLAREEPEKNLPGIRVLKADRRNAGAMKAVLDGNSFEYVADMACYDAQQARQDVSLFPQLRHLAVVSSGAVYGPLHCGALPIREETPRAPRWRYGAEKKGMEDIFFDAWRKEGFPVTIFRPTVTYGRQRTLVRQIAADNTWVARIRRGEPIAVGNGKLLRNFLHVEDAARAFRGAFQHGECKGQAYNLCGLKPYDWESYHTGMMRVLGREVEMIETPLALLQACPDFPMDEMITENFIYNGYYCGEKIARDIPEFRAQITLEDGLCRTVEWMERSGLLDWKAQNSWEDTLIAAQRNARVFVQKEREDAR